MPLPERVAVVAEVNAKPEFIEDVKRECIALVEPSRSEKGCLSYDLHQDIHDPRHFVFVESWEGIEDIESHLESPHAINFDEKTLGMLAEAERIIYLKRID